MKHQNPTPLRLGILKPYLQRLAFDDSSVKSTHELMFKKLEQVVINDPVYGPEYQKEVQEYIKSKKKAA